MSRLMNMVRRVALGAVHCRSSGLGMFYAVRRDHKAEVTAEDPFSAARFKKFATEKEPWSFVRNSEDPRGPEGYLFNVRCPACVSFISGSSSALHWTPLGLPQLRHCLLALEDGEEEQGLSIRAAGKHSCSEKC
ncbi:ribonuclease H1-like isoform X5 [Saccopteryx bilineata]|uniref:ribonuclease H1-like isoform X5 n=1 Tax=Saccopteryx bilineata TaxID=59482 RepID=UPI00338E4036